MYHRTSQQRRPGPDCSFEWSCRGLRWSHIYSRKKDKNNKEWDISSTESKTIFGRKSSNVFVLCDGSKLNLPLNTVSCVAGEPINAGPNNKSWDQPAQSRSLTGASVVRYLDHNMINKIACAKPPSSWVASSVTHGQLPQKMLSRDKTRLSIRLLTFVLV